MPTRTIRLSSASFAWSAHPATEYAATARDRMRIDSGEAYVFVHAVVNIPPGEALVSATLELTTEAVYAGSRTFTAQRVNAPASYSGLNWGNKPSTASGSTAHAVTQAGTVRLWQWDVTADVTGRTTVDWRIISSDTTARHFMGTRTPYISGAPKLVVITTAASTAPDGLSPDGGAVAVASPVLQWNQHEDAIGFKVQIDEADGDFSSPLYDSGEVTSDLAAHTPAYSLTNATEYDWRVFHKFASGLSEPSDPATINRTNKLPATITNPGATSADPTPPVTWTSAGQESWQVIRLVNGVGVANSSAKSGTDVAWAPNVKGRDVGAKRAGDVVTDILRTWDGEDRVGSAAAGDQPWSEDIQVWTYTPEPTVAPMTSVFVTQDGDTPAIIVDYARSSGVPDEVIIGIDGEPLQRQAGVDGGWTCWTAPPNTDAEVYVTAVVDEEASDEDYIASFRTSVGGAWLVDPESGRWFSFSGDQLTLTYGSNTQVFTTVAGAAQVVRVSALRGAAGEIAGEISEVNGKTVAEQVADLWWMRSRPHLTYRLIVGDLNIPVNAWDLWAAFNPETTLRHRVDKNARFTFGQTADELPFEPI